jgi:N-acetylneuraminic acid mutarotase
LYGDTYQGGQFTFCGNDGCGVFYSLNIGAKPFISLVSTSGKVGSKVGILGQGFSSSSVVKFNGVKATTVTRSGTTFLLATVPSSASDGKVTVTTGSTELTSAQTFIVHDSWSNGAAIPTPVFTPASAVLNDEVYLVGGNTNNTTQTAAVQIYNPTTKSWSAGVSLPIPTSNAPAAVVDDILYVIGGYTTAVTNAVWAYDPKTKTWSGKAVMPTARDGAVAVVDKNIIYVAGGYNGSTFIGTVESYDPSTDTWKGEAPMLGNKDLPIAGLIGSTIVVADGASAPGQITGDTEGYNATTNTWTTLATDPTARTGACGAAITSRLYDAGGYINNDGAATTVNESFQLSTNKWTTLAPMPLGTLFSGSAIHNGQLYCFGGESTWTGPAINNVQIYQP